MAKPKPTSATDVPLESDDQNVQKPRLVKLIITNFRCIGERPVEVELNAIVVLVGGNNVGKSTILKAYEVVMSHGSAKGKLSIEDFPRSEVNAAHLPEIEIQTIVYDNTPGDRWITVLPNSERLV